VKPKEWSSSSNSTKNTQSICSPRKEKEEMSIKMIVLEINIAKKRSDGIRDY
jgi:hypothetical protein